MLKRRYRFIAALAALAGMLFLQAAFAYAACELPGGASGMAAMQAAMPECHEAHEAASLCFAHCQSEDQTFGKIQPNVPDLVQPMFSIRLAQAPSGVEPGPALVLPVHAPPPRILFQSFLL